MTAVTNIEKVIGKELSMEVASDVDLNIKVIDEKQIEYQFIGTDGTKDIPVIAKLEVSHDDINDVDDYSFADGIASRFFLFQFE